MHCFYHPDAAAVATCKSCQRGLCFACAVSLPNAEQPLGMACKDRCENEVNEVNALIQSNKKLTKAAPGQFKANANVYYNLAFGSIALASVFIGYGSYELIVFDSFGLSTFLIAGGLIFLWSGFGYWQTAQRLKKANQSHE